MMIWKGSSWKAEMDAEMGTDRKIIYGELVRLARIRERTYYRNLGRLVSMRPRSRQLFSLLDDINASEHRKGRPMITAIVVSHDERMPGSGFFNQAKRLGRMQPEEDKRQFWLAELDRVYDHWGRSQTDD